MVHALASLVVAASISLGTGAEPSAPPTASGSEPDPIHGTFSLGAWIQPLLEYRSWEDAGSTVGSRLRRARLIVDASAMEGRLQIRLMPDLASTPQLRDAWIVLRGSRHWIRMGQQTVPFHLQREVSMARGHFGDRALASRRFELSGGRDVGAVVGGSAREGRLQWSGGLFNGQGPNRTEPSPFPLLASRITAGLGGLPAGAETDLARSPDPVLTLGVGGMGARDSFLRPRPGFAAEQTSEWWAWTLDAHLRYRGASGVGGYFSQSITPTSTADAPTPPEILGTGWFAGAGLVLPAPDWVPGAFWEISARHSRARWDRDRPGDRERESAVGITLFHRLHSLQTRLQLTREEGLPTGLSGRSTRVTLEHQLVL